MEGHAEMESGETGERDKRARAQQNRRARDGGTRRTRRAREQGDRDRGNGSQPEATGTPVRARDEAGTEREDREGQAGETASERWLVRGAPETHAARGGGRWCAGETDRQTAGAEPRAAKPRVTPALCLSVSLCLSLSLSLSHTHTHTHTRRSPSPRSEVLGAPALSVVTALWAPCGPEHNRTKTPGMEELGRGQAEWTGRAWGRLGSAPQSG